MAFRSGSSLLVLAILAISTGFAVAQQVCTGDADCEASLGRFFECKSGQCVCGEFYVIHPTLNECKKIAKLNGTCEFDAQCQGSLGHSSRCNPTTNICECHSWNDPQVNVLYRDEGCHLERPLGAGCISDEECMYRLDMDMSMNRCVNNTCACYNNMDLGLHSMVLEIEGLCQVHCMAPCDINDLSILMSTIAGSVACIAFIFAVWQFTKSKPEKKQKVATVEETVRYIHG